MSAGNAAATPARAVAWEELFFDLALVFALTQLSDLLHDDHTAAGVGRALILFLPVYWTWVAVTLYTDQRNVSNAIDRIGIFALAFSNLMLALTIPDAYGDHGLFFVCIYLTARVLLAVLVLRSHLMWRGLFLGPYGGVVVAGPLLLVGAMQHGTSRIVFWAVAAAVEVTAPLLSRWSVAMVRVQPGHYTHRYGLLITLVLGESVIQVGSVAADEPLTVARSFAIGASFALGCALWWAYFVYGVRAFRRALEQAEQQVKIRLSVLVYGHILFSFAIINIAMGLAAAVVHPLEPLEVAEASLLFGGTALFLLTFAYTHGRIRHQVAWWRISIGVLCLILLPLALVIPSLAALAILVLVVVGASLPEHLVPPRRPGDAGSEEEIHGDPDEADRGPIHAE